MPNRPPPVPPAGRNDKGLRSDDASAPKSQANQAKVTGHDKRLQNDKEQGDHANVEQNTSNRRFHR